MRFFFLSLKNLIPYEGLTLRDDIEIFVHFVQCSKLSPRKFSQLFFTDIEDAILGETAFLRHYKKNLQSIWSTFAVNSAIIDIGKQRRTK